MSTKHRTMAQALAGQTKPDDRLPPIGTTITKYSHGAPVATCKVVDGGILYAGKVYASISGAALAASRALGLAATSANGYIWWGLTQRPSSQEPAAPREIILTLRSPGLESTIMHVLDCALAHAKVERREGAESDGARLALEQDRMKLAWAEHQQRVREWEAQEARRAKGIPEYSFGGGSLP